MEKRQIKDMIDEFILSNTNEEGIDLTKLYFAVLEKRDNGNNWGSFIPNDNKYPINLENDPTKIVIVYILEQLGPLDFVYVDIFNQTILQSTTVCPYGFMSFAPIFRSGVTVSDAVKITDILDVERLPIHEIEKIYKILSTISKEEFCKMSNEDISKVCLSNFKSGRKNN